LQPPNKRPPSAYTLFFNHQIEIASAGQSSRGQNDEPMTTNSERTSIPKRKVTRFTMQIQKILSQWKQLTPQQRQIWDRRAATAAVTDPVGTRHNNDTDATTGTTNTASTTSSNRNRTTNDNSDKATDNKRQKCHTATVRMQHDERRTSAGRSTQKMLRTRDRPPTATPRDDTKCKESTTSTTTPLLHLMLHRRTNSTAAKHHGIRSNVNE
jgi:hypothetical protein